MSRSPWNARARPSATNPCHWIRNSAFTPRPPQALRTLKTDSAEAQNRKTESPQITFTSPLSRDGREGEGTGQGTHGLRCRSPYGSDVGSLRRLALCYGGPLDQPAARVAFALLPSSLFLIEGGPLFLASFGGFCDLSSLAAPGPIRHHRAETQVAPSTQAVQTAHHLMRNVLYTPGSGA